MGQRWRSGGSEAENTYKNPKTKTTIKLHFNFFAKFRFLITGMGSKKIAKSVTIFIIEFPNHSP